MFFSLLFRISRQDIFPLLPPFHRLPFLTNREQLRGRLLVPRLCVIQDSFSTSRKRGRYRAMAHVLVRNWLRSRHRIHRVARQLVSPPSEPISHTVPVIDPPIDRLVNTIPTRTSSALQDTAILSHKNDLHPLPRPTTNQGFIVSLYTPSPTILPRTRTPNRRHSFLSKNTLVCVCSGKTP